MEGRGPWESERDPRAWEGRMESFLAASGADSLQVNHSAPKECPSADGFMDTLKSIWKEFSHGRIPEGSQRGLAMNGSHGNR